MAGQNPLIALVAGLWACDGPVVAGAAGFHFPTRMLVIGLPDGALALWSPVAPDPQLCAAVAALGPVRFLIAPNRLHDRFLIDWLRIEPAATILAAPGLAQARPDLSVAELASGHLPAALSSVLEQVLFDNRIAPELVFFHAPTGTVIFTDLLQHLPGSWFHGWRRLVAWLDQMTGDQPHMPRKFRWALAKRNAAARLTAERICDWPVQQLVMAHGPVVSQNAAAILRQALGFLLAK